MVSCYLHTAREAVRQARDDQLLSEGIHIASEAVRLARSVICYLWECTRG